MVQLVFVPVDSKGGPRSTDERHAIRSHCMIGKNKRPDSRRSRQALKKQQLAARLPFSQEQDLDSSIRGDKEQSEANIIDPHSLDGRAILAMTACIHVLSMGRMPSDLELLGLPQQSYMSRCKELIYKYGVIKKIIYPVDQCVDFGHELDPNCAGLFTYDAGFVHSLLFISSTLEEFVLRRPVSRTTLFHSKQTLAYLSRTLSDPDSHVSDATLYIVLSLSFVASIIGDRNALTLHLAGLKRITHLRGGINDRLRFKIDRMDLSVYLNSGSPSYYSSGPVIWASCFQSKPPLLACSPEMMHLLYQIRNARLTTLLHDVQYFAHLMSQHQYTDNRLNARVFNDSLNSIQSRLFALEDEPLDMMEECLRLSLLALLSTTLQLPSRKTSASHFKLRFQRLCLQLWRSSSTTEHIIFWILMVGLVSVFEEDELWLINIWQNLPSSILPWDGAKLELQNFIWVGCLHDELGRKAFTALASRLQSVPGTE